VRFRDGHTEVYRNPKSVLYTSNIISLTFDKSSISLERRNILFVENSTFEEVVKPKKEEKKSAD
jgi:hypothetical protein